MVQIYTRKGDQGKCRLGNGRAVLKFDPRVEALGELDELNAILGLILALNKPSPAPDDQLKLKAAIKAIQKDLMFLGAVLGQSSRSTKQAGFNNRVIFLEQQIDELNKKLPPLENFILPGGCLTAAGLHLARAVCRRVERRVVRALAKTSKNFQCLAETASFLAYFNRLSDFLFTLARWVNFQAGERVELWP